MRHRIDRRAFCRVIKLIDLPRHQPADRVPLAAKQYLFTY
jgi:hypothetical protein